MSGETDRDASAGPEGVSDAGCEAVRSFPASERGNVPGVTTIDHSTIPSARTLRTAASMDAANFRCIQVSRNDPATPTRTQDPLSSIDVRSANQCWKFLSPISDRRLARIRASPQSDSPSEDFGASAPGVPGEPVCSRTELCSLSACIAAGILGCIMRPLQRISS